MAVADAVAPRQLPPEIPGCWDAYEAAGARTADVPDQGESDGWRAVLLVRFPIGETVVIVPAAPTSMGWEHGWPAGWKPVAVPDSGNLVAPRRRRLPSSRMLGAWHQ